MTRSSIPTESSSTTARIPISSSPPTRAPRPSPTSPTRSRSSATSGSATPSPAAARTAMTTRRWGSPPRARGSRSSATSSNAGVDVQTDSITRRRLRRHVGRRVRQRHAAVEGDQAGRRVRPSPHLHRSRRPTPRRAGPSASACSTCRARAGTITTAPCCRQGAMIVPRSQKAIELTAEARSALGIEVATIDPASLISAILKAPVDLLWFGGIGTYIKASYQTHAQVGDPANDCAARRRQGRPRHRHRRRRQPRHQPGRRGSSSPRAAGASTPTSSTIARASIARTMRSTSRSRSTAKCAKGG